MRVTLRTFDQSVRDHAKKRIIEMSQSIAEGFGATAKIDIPHGLPVVVNSTKEMEFAKEVALELVGEENIGEFPISSGSEDFAHYLAHKPGCFIRVGNGKSPLRCITRNSISPMICCRSAQPFGHVLSNAICTPERACSRSDKIRTGESSPVLSALPF